MTLVTVVIRRDFAGTAFPEGAFSPDGMYLGCFGVASAAFVHLIWFAWGCAC